MTTYKLLPILERLQACWPAREWVTKNKYKTFKEAWEAAPAHYRWHAWVVYEMSLRFPRGEALRLEARENWWGIEGTNHTEQQRDFYVQDRVRALVEAMLIEYALLNNCAVEET